MEVERAVAQSLRGKRSETGGIGGRDRVDPREPRERRVDPGAQLGERIERQRLAENGGEGADNRPVLARFAGRKGGAVGHLHAPLGVDVSAGFFGVGRARQDDVGAMRAAVAMRADIDHECARLDIDFIGTDQEGDIQRASLGHRGGVEAALPRDKADIERADAGGGGVQHRKTGPVAFRRAELRGQRQNGGAVLARQRPLPHQDQRTLSLGEDLAEAFAGATLASVSGPAPR